MLYDYSQWLYGLNISTFVLNLNFKQEILCNLRLMILQCKSTSFVKCLLQFHELNELFSSITVTLEIYTGIPYDIYQLILFAKFWWMVNLYYLKWWFHRVNNKHSAREKKIVFFFQENMYNRSNCNIAPQAKMFTLFW